MNTNKNAKPQPNKELQTLQGQFKSLCNEQESLYRNDFETVFAKLYEIDSKQKAIYNTENWFLGEDIPNEVDEATILMAIEQSGFSDDETFCKNFIRYANIVLQGKKNMQERVILNTEQVTEYANTNYQVNGWNFYPIAIISPTEMHGMIKDILIDDAKNGKGLFNNSTNIPLEDVEEDEFAMIEAYNCKASLLPYLDELKRYNIIGTGTNKAFLDADFKSLLLKTLHSLATYAKEHTDSPAQTKNEITERIKCFDDIPIWGLFLQILLLQGLCRWLENLDINEGNNGYYEAQSFYEWLTIALGEKLLKFTMMPFSNKDKERLNTLCEYLYSTEIGKLTLEVVFGENKKTSKEEKSTIITDRAKKYFDKAIAVGYMAETETGYKWLWGGNKGKKARLSYFLHKIYNPDGCQVTQYKQLENLFNESRLDSSTSQLMNAKKPQEWRNIIDKLFQD